MEPYLSTTFIIRKKIIIDGFLSPVREQTTRQLNTYEHNNNVNLTSHSFKIGLNEDILKQIKQMSNTYFLVI